MGLCAAYPTYGKLIEVTGGGRVKWWSNTTGRVDDRPPSGWYCCITSYNLQHLAMGCGLRRAPATPEFLLYT